uniref:Uncharacterized protein n=1 Tax=Arundo donax TaxID=35708 RepID=A0A0A9CQM0_ARUDO
MPRTSARGRGNGRRRRGRVRRRGRARGARTPARWVPPVGC